MNIWRLSASLYRLIVLTYMLANSRYGDGCEGKTLASPAAFVIVRCCPIASRAYGVELEDGTSWLEAMHAGSIGWCEASQSGACPHQFMDSGVSSWTNAFLS